MYSHLLTGLLALAQPTGAAGAQSPSAPPAAATAAVTALLQAFADARDRFDAAALDRLLAPDYLEVSPRGEIDGRAAVLGFYAADKAVPVPAMTRAVQDVRVRGDTAIVIGSVSFGIPAPGGGTAERTVRVTYVGQRIAGRWLMASVQYTPVPPVRPAP